MTTENFDLQAHIDSIVRAHSKKGIDPEYLKREMIALREALLEGRYWSRIDSVARSGMSCKIIVAYAYLFEERILIRRVYNELLCIVGFSKDGRVSDCGMDEVQYSLFQLLCPDKRYQLDMPEYNSLP